MQHLRNFRLTRAMAARMAADAVMVNLALMISLAIRFALQVAIQPAGVPLDAEQAFRTYVAAYAHNAALLTVISLVVFSLLGFYTYGRNYGSQYKALVIGQGVTLSYLIFGFLTYFLWDLFGLTQVPRTALLLAFATNLGFTLASRTWTALWERVIRPERVLQLQDKSRTGGRNVLVIGGAGYIGSALLPKLLEKGYRVRVLDLFLYGSEPISNVADHPNLELIEGDFRRVDKVVLAMRDMDAVIHLGAIVGDPACDLDQSLTIDVNLVATKMIAQVAKASGISRFIFASTCSVYGAGDETLDERSELNPVSLYGRTKLAAERGLQSMADDTFTPTLIRFATIYGLSGRTRFDLVVNLLTAKAKVDGQITIFGGSQWRPFVHVDDAALGVFTILEAELPLVANQVFNVGSDAQNYTIEDVGRLIHEQIFSAELILDENSPDKRNYRVSFRKIHDMLGYEPNWTVEDGIRQVAEAVASGAVEDYREAKYSNVKFLRDAGAIEIVRTDDDWARTLDEPEVSPEVAAS